MKTHSLETNLSLIVLAGGDSAERAISLQSGADVSAALASAGHRVIVADPLQQPLEGIDFSNFDACFLALHGGAGEDGRVQRTLDLRGVPFTGSGPEACRLAMSKSLAKERFFSSAVPTPPFVTLDTRLSPNEVMARLGPLEFPLVIKPDAQGSSLGLSLVEAPAEVADCVAKALRCGASAIAEPLVRGREFTVALLDDRPLPIIEIISPEPVFSYDAKYHSSLTEYQFDFELADSKRSEIAAAATAAARALGTAGLARVDVMLGHDGRVWVLEVNTTPGMTARSLAPRAALRAGLDLAALCDLLVRKSLTTMCAS